MQRELEITQTIDCTTPDIVINIINLIVDKSWKYSRNILVRRMRHKMCSKKQIRERKNELRKQH